MKPFIRRTRHPVVAGSLIASVLIAAPFAAAGTGDSLREGKRNGTAVKETEIIGNMKANPAGKGGFVTRQSNISEGPGAGGGAVYGCRTPVGGTTAGTAPCLRGSNLAGGSAFEFASSGGPKAGEITIGDPAVANPGAPFTTNANGIATGLNADMVDGKHAADLIGAKGDKGDKGDPGKDAVADVGLSSKPNAQTVTGTTSTALTSLAQSITVPAGETRRILATLSGESLCTGTAGNYCSVRILVDGTELTPQVYTDFAFDSVNDSAGSSASWESNSIQRYSAPLAAGAHSVTVEARATDAGTSLRFDDAVLSVMQIAG